MITGRINQVAILWGRRRAQDQPLPTGAPEGTMSFPKECKFPTISNTTPTLKPFDSNQGSRQCKRTFAQLRFLKPRYSYRGPSKHEAIYNLGFDTQRKHFAHVGPHCTVLGMDPSQSWNQPPSFSHKWFDLSLPIWYQYIFLPSQGPQTTRSGSSLPSNFAFLIASQLCPVTTTLRATGTIGKLSSRVGTLLSCSRAAVRKEEVSQLSPLLTLFHMYAAHAKAVYGANSESCLRKWFLSQNRVRVGGFLGSG
jgi:hypothetical protein